LEKAVPSWDLFVGLFFVVTMAYGFIMQREKIVATLLAVYVGIVISQLFGGTLFQFFQGDKTLFGSLFIKSSASPFTVQTALFLGTVLLLSARGGIQAAKAKGLLSPLEIFGYSFLTAALMITTIINFLPFESQGPLIEQSKMLSKLMHYQTLWLVAPIVWLIFTGNKRRSSED